MAKARAITVPLKDIIRSIRTELLDAAEQHKKEEGADLFVVEKVEIECGFVVEKTSTAAIEVGVLLGNVDGEMNYKREETNRIRIVLSAKSEDYNFLTEQILLDK